jgi:hypothetical protein
MLIEIEDRHKRNAIRDVHAFFAALGYEGYFLLDKKLIPVSSFDLATHQNAEHISGLGSNWRRCGVYINIFSFMPVNESHRLETAVSKVRSNLSDLFQHRL